MKVSGFEREGSVMPKWVFPKMVGFPNLHPKCWSFFVGKQTHGLTLGFFPPFKVGNIPK